MEAKELRIGNHLKWSDESENIVIVTGIRYSRTLKEYFVQYDELDKNELSGMALLSEFEPIELTKELVLQIGYTEPEDNDASECHDLIGKLFKHKKAVTLCLCKEDGLFYTWYKCEDDYYSHRYLPVPSVHILQNINFIFNGIELKLKQVRKRKVGKSKIRGQHPDMIQIF